MGKKASLKHDLSYEDDDYDYCDDEFFEHDIDSDYGENPHTCGRTTFSTHVASRAKSRTVSVKKQPAVRKIADNGQCISKVGLKNSDVLVRLAPPTKVLYYVTDPRVTFSMLDNDTILHVLAYLPLHSISSLSCANKFLDNLLSSDFLYCLGRSEANILPCVRELQNVLPLDTEDGQPRPRGIARKFAIESEIYSPRGNMRNRNFAVVDHVRSREEVDNFLVHGRAVSFIKKSCEIITRWCDNKTAQSLTPPNCEHLLCSAYHKRTCICAILATTSRGRCRYVLSLVALPTRRGEEHELLWQHKLPQSNLFSSSRTQSLVQFNIDGSRILFGSMERCFVIDSLGNYSWAMNNSSVTSCVIHDKFMFGFQGKTLNIYDVTKEQTPIASGTLPKGSSSLEQTVTTRAIQFFGGRIWMIGKSQLMCTTRLMHSLRKLTSNHAPLSVKIACVSNLEPYEHKICCHGDCLYVASGKSIRSYNRRNIALPYKTYVAETPIDSMCIDSTKIVCSTMHPNGRSGRIEIIPVCPTGGAYPSVFVKKTFLSSHRMDDIQFCGRLLAVSYSYETDTARSCGGEIQVFDIQRDLDA